MRKTAGALSFIITLAVHIGCEQKITPPSLPPVTNEASGENATEDAVIAYYGQIFNAFITELTDYANRHSNFIQYNSIEQIEQFRDDTSQIIHTIDEFLTDEFTETPTVAQSLLAYREDLQLLLAILDFQLEAMKSQEGIEI